MLNMAPIGFVPGCITSSYVLCPGNVEYYLANKLAKILHDLNFSPNHVTIINNLFVRIPSLMVLYYRYYYIFINMIITSQILDCTDGQIARNYNCGSEFGAWLDHTTDIWYGIFVSIITIFNIYLNTGFSTCFACIVFIPTSIAMIGQYSIDVKENGILWCNLTFMQTMGVIQEWYMSYLYILLFTLVAWYDEVEF
jgi:phosphatidylglycerophosphate synthase